MKILIIKLAVYVSIGVKLFFGFPNESYRYAPVRIAHQSTPNVSVIRKIISLKVASRTDANRLFSPEARLHRM